MILKKNLSDTRGISKGTKEMVFSIELCNRIRKRLNLTTKQLSNKQIREVVKLSNVLIGDWVVNNPEGYMMEIGFNSKHPMGVLAPSKYLSPAFREDKEETIDKIQALDIPEQRRQQYLKRYNIDIGRNISMGDLVKLGELNPQINIKTFFYTFKIMWFNKRNCKNRKGKSYRFQAVRSVNTKLSEQILKGKEYYEWDFTAFYKHKLKPEL